MPDRFEDFRKKLGNNVVDAIIAKFNLTPNDKKVYICPQCGSNKAYHKEIHPDTEMNDIVLFCPECNFLDE